MTDLTHIADDLQDMRRVADHLLSGNVQMSGSWTPTYNGATPGTTTYSTQSGYYIRIGRLVIAQADLTWTNATGTGVVRLGGLPFTSASGIIVAFPVAQTNVTFANGSVYGLLQGGQTQAQLFSPATNAAGTELTVEVAGTLRYTITYFTA